MTMNTYVSLQLRRARGTVAYGVAYGLIMLVVLYWPAAPYLAVMALGTVAHLAGAKAYRVVVGDRTGAIS